MKDKYNSESEKMTMVGMVADKAEAKELVFIAKVSSIGRRARELGKEARDGGV